MSEPIQNPSIPPLRRRSGRKRRAPTPVSTKLLTIFWMLCAILLVYTLWTSPGRPLVFTVTGLMVCGCALLPSYLWCSGKARGLPIWPLSCATTVLTYGVQLLASYSRLDVGPEAIWRASLTVSAFLLVGTLVWWFWITRPVVRQEKCLTIRTHKVAGLLFSLLAISTIYTVFTNAGWLDFLTGGAATAVRGFMRGPTALAVFMLAMRWGERKLRPSQIAWFIFWVVVYCVADAVSLYLITCIIAGLMMLVGFAVGRKTIPWMMIGVFVGALGLLHLGKADMRTKYWGENLAERTPVAPWQYPSFYAEWAKSSTIAIALGKKGEEESASLLERANTIYLLLQAQAMSPSQVPFLHGRTYAIIPSSLVPRILWPGKASPHESTTMLNVHYGNQTVEAAQVTSIGWGLLNEAYANFGYLGCLGLAVLLGSFYGWMAWWSIGFPATSLRTFIGIFTLSFAIQTEMSAAVYISAYFQGLVALWAVVRLFSTRDASEQPPAKMVSQRPAHGRARWNRSAHR